MVLPVHGLMPKHNPILGTFQHAPSSRTGRSKYFKDIISVSEYELRKELRHNPYTGQFHSGPRQFSRLHGLQRFRTSSIDEDANGRAGAQEKGHAGAGETRGDAGAHVSSVATDGTSSVQSLSYPSSVTSEREEDSLAEAKVDPRNVYCAEFGVVETESGSHNYRRLRCFSSDSPLHTVEDIKIDTAVRSETGETLSASASTTATGFCAGGQRNGAKKIRRVLAASPRRRSSSTSLQHPVAGLIRTSTRIKPTVTSAMQFGTVDFSSSGGSGGSSSSLGSYGSGDGNGNGSGNKSGTRNDAPVEAYRFGGKSEHPYVRTSPRSLARTESMYAVKQSPQVRVSARRASTCSIEDARRPSATFQLCRDGQVDYDGETNPFLNGWMADIPWIVNQTEQITIKYKIDMSKTGSLGKGAYSLAKVALDRESGKAYAVKIVKKRMLVSNEEKDMIKREVKIHQLLLHDRIVRLHDIFEDEKRLFLVMELARDGTLESLLRDNGGRLIEALCHHLFRQILQALRYLHDNGVLQGDLKPANLLLTQSPKEPNPVVSWRIKVCDFGLSRKVPDIKYYKFTGDVHKVPFTSLCGTMGYVAPEILRQEPYGISSDMWSAGIILYEMLSGIKPFVPYRDCLSVPLEFPQGIFGATSAEAMDLCCRLLTLDVSERLSAKAALRHSWTAVGLL